MLGLAGQPSQSQRLENDRSEIGVPRRLCRRNAATLTEDGTGARPDGTVSELDLCSLFNGHFIGLALHIYPFPS